MNTDDVRAELDRIGTDPSRYSLKGETPDDGFALKREGGSSTTASTEAGTTSRRSRPNTPPAAIS
jgi:hypothetical protein